MKNLLTLLLLCAASLSYSQTKIVSTIIVDSVEREFIVSKPSGEAPVGGYPIVVMFHGTTDDGEQFYKISEWKEKGEIEKFISVFPSSRAYCIIEDGGPPYTTTKWNTGELQSKLCPGQNVKDDVKFIRRMLDTIAKTIPIDKSRIYASGFSSGGVFTSKLLVEMSDVFAALASHAGSLHRDDSGAVKRLIPFFYSIGSDDDQSLNFGYPSFPFNDSTPYIHRDLINRYLSVLGLSQEYTKDSIAVVLRYRFKTVAVAADWEFNYTLLKGLEHKYPNSGNFPVTAANVLWEFFKQYTLPLSVKKSGDELQPIYLRPNPATDYIIVDEDATVTLFTSTGAEVFRVKAMQDERIALPKLASGIYIAKIETKSGTKSAKVVVQ